MKVGHLTEQEAWIRKDRESMKRFLWLCWDGGTPIENVMTQQARRISTNHLRSLLGKVVTERFGLTPQKPPISRITVRINGMFQKGLLTQSKLHPDDYIISKKPEFVDTLCRVDTEEPNHGETPVAKPVVEEQPTPQPDARMWQDTFRDCMVMISNHNKSEQASIAQTLHTLYCN